MLKEITTQSKNVFTKSEFVIAISISLIIGAFLTFIPNLIFRKASNFSNNKVGSSNINIQEVKSIQSKFGGTQSKIDAQKFTEEFSIYLREVEKVNSEFEIRYTASTYYTAEEIYNWVKKVIDENSRIPADSIRLYFCPIMYPNLTKNPITGYKITGPRLGSNIVALKPPYNLITKGVDKLNIENNPNTLGCYNWGGLEP